MISVLKVCPARSAPIFATVKSLVESRLRSLDHDLAQPRYRNSLAHRDYAVNKPRHLLDSAWVMILEMINIVSSIVL